MNRDKGKSILLAVRVAVTVAGVVFFMALFTTAEPLESLWIAGLAFALVLLGLRVSIDLSHGRIKRTLNEISEETVWYEPTVHMGDAGILSQGLLALTGSHMIYVPLHGSAGRLDVSIEEIREVEFGKMRKQVPCAKITRNDGGTMVFSMSHEAFVKFADQVHQLKLDLRR